MPDASGASGASGAPDTAALLQAYYDLSTQVGQISVLSNDVTELKRQLQTLQGGGGMLEPLSLISGWTEKSPTTIPATGTFIGVGQVLLAGSGLTIQKPANTPFLRLKMAGAFANYDYVVDSNGAGTHTALYGASGALAAAIATGLNKDIWICTTHVEPAVTATQSLDGLAESQIITIESGSAFRPTLTVGASIDLHSTTTLLTSWTKIIYRHVQFSVSSTFTANLFSFQAGGNAPSVELHDISFTGFGTWRSIEINGKGISSDLEVYHCTGTLTQITTDVGTDSANNNLGYEGNTGVGSQFVIENCTFMLTNIVFRVAYTHGEPATYMRFVSNRLTINGYALVLTFMSSSLVMTANQITNAYNGQFLILGNSASDYLGNIVITGNYYDGSGGGNNTQFAVLVLSLDVFRGISIIGNTLVGPGSTSIAINVYSTWNNSVAVEPNAFYNWGTEVFGGTTEFFGNVTIDGQLTTKGGLAVGFAPHSSLSLLVAPADDHTQYAKLLGRGTPVGNVFVGYTSWGTWSQGNFSSVVKGYNPGGYWRMGETSGNLADSSGNGNTATQVGTGQTYGVSGAIVGDSNTAIAFPGVNTSYYTIANAANIDTGDVFTFMGWIKKANDGTDMCIMTRAINGYDIRMSAANTLMLNKCWVIAIVASTATITGTGWHFVAVTKNGAAVNLYIDGVNVTGTVTNQTIAATGGPHTIGRNGQDGTLPWNGSLDEIVLINGTALSASSILAVYTAGTSGGSATTPVNTLDGDITGLRLSLGNVVFPVGVEAYIAGNTLMTGYLGVGRATAPSDTTAGSLTVTTLHVGDAANFSMIYGASLANIQFDTNDQLSYNQAADRFGFQIGNIQYGAIEASGNAALFTAGTPTTQRGIFKACGDGTSPGTIYIDNSDNTNTYAIDAYEGHLRFMDVLGVEWAHLGLTHFLAVGYGRFGSLTAPANTTAGDLTAMRVVFGTDAAMPASTSIYLNAATKVNGNIGFFNTTPTTQPVSAANLTNNVTAGGTTDQIDDFTSLTVYATDAAAIHSDIYQLARKLKQINDGLRALGLFT